MVEKFLSTQCREHYLEHRGGVTYLCQYCSGVYKKSANLYDHVRIVHGSVYCDICQTLVTPRGLIAHMAKQHRKTYKCQFCEKVFNDSGALENHINTSPDAVCSPNDWPCSTCGHNYSSKSLLEEHIQSCHRNRKAKRCKPLRKQQKNSKRRQLSKSIMCEVCARFCPSVAALNYHLRSHTGERPYKCTSCNKSFCLKTQLQQHSRSHTGERPFRCSDCPKAFASKSNLLRHRLVHSKLRPYTCHICNKKFQQKSCVQLHIRTVHMNTPLPPRIRKRKRKIDEEPEKIIAENKEVGVELENETVDGNEERRNNFKRRSMREIGEKKTKEVEPENGNEDSEINDFENFKDNDEEMLVEDETQDCKDTIEDSDGEIISNCDSDDRQENDKIDYEGEKIMNFLEDWEA